MKKPSYFKNPKTGLKFEYTDMLAKRKDLIPVYDDEKEAEVVADDADKGNFVCEWCGRHFKNKGGLILHKQYCPKKPKDATIEDAQKIDKVV